MIHKLKVTQLGDEMAIIMPGKLAKRLGISNTTSVNALEMADVLTLLPTDMELDNQLHIAERVMRKNRDALRELGQ